MAYPNHCLFTMSGAWTSSDMVGEVWQVGIRLYTGNPSNNWLANPTTYLAAVAPGVKTWFNTNPGVIDSRATLTMLKCNNIKPDGHYKDPTTVQLPVTGAAGHMPGSAAIFNTLATTLETGHTTGRARRGRIYLPVYVSPNAGQGVTVTDTLRDNVRDAVKSLLGVLLINEPTGGLLVRPCIASRIDASINDINGVSVNSVIDVQRRRKNRVRGTRSTVAAFP